MIPLYPLFDLRVAGTVQHGWRDGIVEFHPFNLYPLVEPNGTYAYPNLRETMNLYELKPSVSRFLGADKLTVKFALIENGPVLKRFKAGARGSAKPRVKRMSRLRIILSDGKSN